MNLKPIRHLLLAAAAMGLAVPAVLAGTPANRPLRVIQTYEPRFPITTDTMTLSHGEARVMINVNAEGKLVDYLVINYTERAFAEEAVRAVKAWRYEPAVVKGEPVGARMALEFDFRAQGNVVTTLPVQMYNNFVSSLFGQTVTWRVCSADDLDHPLRVLKTVRPKYAGAAWKGGSPSGTVLLDFYVDATGRPRMPVVVHATDPLFAAAATSALEKWRFTTPTRGGQPVAVRVEQEFVFAD